MQLRQNLPGTSGTCSNRHPISTPSHLRQLFFCCRSAIKALQNPFSRCGESTPSISAGRNFCCTSKELEQFYSWATNESGSGWRRGPIKVTALKRERGFCCTSKKPTWLLARGCVCMELNLNRHVVADSDTGYRRNDLGLALPLSNKGNILKASCLPLALQSPIGSNSKITTPWNIP